ncbi:MAG: ABC transporter permease [Dehalococcoidales bacterium]
MKKWFNYLAIVCSTVWVGIGTHKLRSFLTMLGIVIGVTSVIVLMSIGNGAESDILNRIGSLGANLVTIRPGAVSFGGVRGAAGGSTTLTLEDAEAISQLPYIAIVAPSYSRSLQLVVGVNNMNSAVNGITSDYLTVNNLSLANGRSFSDFEYQRGETVVVLGTNVKDTLFANVDPIGQQLRMGNIIMTVIGVLASNGQTFGSPDDAVFVPLTAMQQTVAQPRTASGGHVVSSISLEITDQSYATTVNDEITNLLRTRHQLSAATDNDFNISSMAQLVATVSQTANTLTLLLGAIAAISLLVGGIGVMNIMLVSVLERTREIGIRKALGARERDIWTQFLVEAAVLTFAGGIIGVVLGWVVSEVVSRVASMTTVISPGIVIMAVSVSVGIGLFFGFYPAWNASRLNPIEALRSE